MNSRQETPSEWQGEARRIKLHGPEEFAAMRKAGRLAASTKIAAAKNRFIVVLIIRPSCPDHIPARGSPAKPLRGLFDLIWAGESKIPPD